MPPLRRITLLLCSLALGVSSVPIAAAAPVEIVGGLLGPGRYLADYGADFVPQTYVVCSPELLPIDAAGRPLLQRANGLVARLPVGSARLIPRVPVRSVERLQVLIAPRVIADDGRYRIKGVAADPVGFVARAQALLATADAELRLLSAGAVRMATRVVVLDQWQVISHLTRNETFIAPDARPAARHHFGVLSQEVPTLLIHPPLTRFPSDASGPISAYLTLSDGQTTEITLPLNERPSSDPVDRAEVGALLHEWLHAVDIRRDSSDVDLHDTRGYAPNAEGLWQGYYARAIAERFDLPTTALLPERIEGCGDGGSTFEPLPQRCRQELIDDHHLVAICQPILPDASSHCLRHFDAPATGCLSTRPWPWTEVPRLPTDTYPSR